MPRPPIAFLALSIVIACGALASSAGSRGYNIVAWTTVVVMIVLTLVMAVWR